MAFPLGLAGLFESHIKPWWIRRQAERQSSAERLAAAHAAYPEAPAPRLPKENDASGKLPPGVSGQQA
jgi:urea transport system permease protein